MYKELTQHDIQSCLGLLNGDVIHTSSPRGWGGLGGRRGGLGSFTTCSRHWNSNWSGALAGSDLGWSLLLRAVAGIVPQLLTVKTCDSRGGVAAPGGLADGAASEAGATDTGGTRVKSYWRGPGGGRRSKTDRELSTGPSSLRVTLISTRL